MSSPSVFKFLPVVSEKKIIEYILVYEKEEVNNIVLIMAGGYGKRLKPIISSVPKPMASINGKPFLELILNKLNKFSFERVHLSVGFMHEKIINYFGNKFKNIQINYIIEKTPLGTGGAIKLALDRCIEDHVYILNGDSFLDINYFEIEENWLRVREPIIVVKHLNNTSRYGCVHLEGNKVLEFKEKKSALSGFINSGLYVLPKKIKDHFADSEAFSFEKEFLNKNISILNFNAFIFEGMFIDIGIPSAYKESQKLLKKYY